MSPSYSPAREPSPRTKMQHTMVGPVDGVEYEPPRVARKVIPKALRRWGKKDPAPDQVMADHFGTDEWDRIYPGLASYLSDEARRRGA